MKLPRVLVTRPRNRAGGLSAALSARGMQPVEFPLLRIERPSNPHDAGRALDALDAAAVVVFVSANAVDHALRLRPKLLRRIPTASLLALGRGTARALERVGRDDVGTPAGCSTTESLLELRQLRLPGVRGTRVGVVRGEGGRELLARTLRERGALVLEAAVYRRLGPGPGFTALLDAQRGALCAAIVTSAEALEYLAQLAAGSQHPEVMSWPLVLPSERVARRAVELGFTAASAAVASMSDDALADAALELVSARGVRMG